MKRVIALGATLALLLAPVLVRLLRAQAPSAPPPPPPTFKLTDLGSLNGASGIDQLNVRTGPTALNSNAQVAGFRYNLAFGDQPIGFLWNKGTFTDLGTGGGPQSYAYGINDAGQIVGTSNFVASASFPGDLTGNSSRAFIWQNGVMTMLDPDPNNWSRAYAINKNGDVAGFLGPGGIFPVIWKAGVGRTMLASLPCSLVACQGEALAINDIGQAAGWSVGGNVNSERPVMWDSNGQPTDLISNPGSYAQANGINNGSVVIGYYQPQGVSNNLIHAFSWQGGTLTDLGAVGTDTYSGAWGINTKGDIVGISATNAGPILGGGGGRAFLRTGGVMYDLTSLVPGTNWILDAAFAINDSGQVVGIGHTVGSIDVHGYLLTPIITPTTTTISSSVNPSAFGQQVSFTATVAPTQSSSLTPTGNVTFNDGTTVLGTVTLSSGTAVFNTAGLAVGTHAISASYAGDNNFGPSTSSVVNQAVDGASTSTSLAGSPNPANTGQTVTFTATVTPVAPGAGTPTGTVKFLDGTTTLGTGAVNSAGNATFSTSSLAVGSHSISAVYGGDTDFVGSMSNSVNQVISQPATATALAASPNPANVGQTVTFTATVTVIAPGTGTPTGTVTFLDGSTTLGIGVLSPVGTAMLSTSSFAVGSHTMTASYGGDATFAGSTSTGVIVTVQAPPPPVVQIADNETIHVTDAASFPDVFDPEKITVTDQVNIQVLNTTSTSISAPSVTYGTAASATISVSSSTATASGNVTLSVDGGTPSTMSLTNGSATFNLGALNAGAHLLSANFAAQGNFIGSSAETILRVQQATPTITWANPAPITYGTLLSNAQLNASASIAGSFAYSPAVGALLNAGSQTLSATFTPIDTANYTTATATVTLVVNKASSTITWPTPASIFYPTPLSGMQLNATASVPGSFVYSRPVGTVLSGGTQTLSVAFTPTDATDYTPATATVSIIVIPPVQIVDNETITVADKPSFPDVFDPEKITVTDQVSVIPCDFTLTANSPLNVQVGGSSSTPVTITSTNGCDLQVSLTAPSPFLGATVSLPSTATTGGSSTSATLTVTAGPSVTPTSFTVTITGTSGLTHSVSVNVNITASIAGTMGVVQTLTNAGAINNGGVANALTSKLSAAQSAPNSQTSINTLKAFQNQVQAQAGQHIATSFTLAGVTFNPVSTLIGNGQALIDSFRVSMIPDPITGYVVNSSGVGVPGATLSIADATGNIVASTTSDVTGFYYMATTGVLTPGATYTLAVTGFPAGFASALPSSQAFTWQGAAVAFSNFVLN